jgi:hypothetical protein
MGKYNFFITLIVTTIFLAFAITAAFAQTPNTPQCKNCEAATAAFVTCYGSTQIVFTDPNAIRCVCQPAVLGGYDE